MFEGHKFAEDLDIAQRVLVFAYDNARESAIKSYLEHWERKNKDLIDLLGGELRVFVDDIDIVDEEVEGDEGLINREYIFNLIDEKMGNLVFNPIKFTSTDLNGKQYNAMKNMIDRYTGRHGMSWDWLSTRNTIHYSAKENLIKAAQEYSIRVPQLIKCIIQDLTIEEIRNNKFDKTRGGMKINKFIKTCVPEKYHYDIDTLWSTVVQNLKPTPLNNSVVISAAPIDHLFQSEANDWSSCHCMHAEHGSAGCATAADPYTLVAYKTKDINMSRFGISYPDKSWRQLIHVDIKKGSAVFGREYPSALPDIATAVRAKINQLLAEYHGVEAYWKKKRSNGYVEAGRVPYHDLRHTNAGVRTMLKTLEGAGEPALTYGTGDFPCLCCGWSDGAEDIHYERPYCGGCDEDSDTFCCDSCGGRYYDRGELMSTEDGEEFCEDCYNQIFFCCHSCGDTHYRENGLVVRLRHRHTSALHYYPTTVCESCSSDYVRCEDCGDYFESDRVTFTADTEEPYCEDCVGNNAVFCSECEEYVSREDVTYIDDLGYDVCSECKPEEEEAV